jgi:transcriptional regulator with XRE-family HTH domain
MRLALPGSPSQSEIARRLDMTEQAYGRIERGYTKRPGARLLARLSQVFGDEVAALFAQINSEENL